MRRLDNTHTSHRCDCDIWRPVSGICISTGPEARVLAAISKRDFSSSVQGHHWASVRTSVVGDVDIVDEQGAAVIARDAELVSRSARHGDEACEAPSASQPHADRRCNRGFVGAALTMLQRPGLEPLCSSGLEQLAHAAATRKPSKQATSSHMLVTADDSPDAEPVAASAPTAGRDTESTGGPVTKRANLWRANRKRATVARVGTGT